MDKNKVEAKKKGKKRGMREQMKTNELVLRKRGKKKAEEEREVEEMEVKKQLQGRERWSR